jgi:hypothetical protein
MAPKGLKIGDTFDEVDCCGVFRNRVIGFDDQGRYIAEFVCKVEPNVIPVKEVIEEELPFTIPDDELVEEQPVVEEVKEKKTAPKKTTTKKKTTAKKTSKK